MPDQHAPAPSWRHRLRRKNHKSEQSSADPPLPGHQGVSSSTGEPQRASEDAKEQQHRDTAGASTVQANAQSIESSSDSGSLRDKWWRKRKGTKRNTHERENAGIKPAVQLTRRVPLSDTPHVTVQSLTDWLSSAAAVPDQSSSNVEATNAHHGHLAYCEELLTHVLEEVCKQGVKLPEFVHASSESPSASDWEREAVGKYREMASWIEQHMSVKEGPSTLTSEDNHLQQLLVSAVHEEASKRVAKADRRVPTLAPDSPPGDVLNRTEILNGLAAALFPTHRHIFSCSQRFFVRTPRGNSSTTVPLHAKADPTSSCPLNGASTPLVALHGSLSHTQAAVAPYVNTVESSQLDVHLQASSEVSSRSQVPGSTPQCPGTVNTVSSPRSIDTLHSSATLNAPASSPASAPPSSNHTSATPPQTASTQIGALNASVLMKSDAADEINAVSRVSAADGSVRSIRADLTNSAGDSESLSSVDSDSTSADCTRTAPVSRLDLPPRVASINGVPAPMHAQIPRLNLSLVFAAHYEPKLSSDPTSIGLEPIPEEDSMLSANASSGEIILSNAAKDISKEEVEGSGRIGDDVSAPLKLTPCSAAPQPVTIAPEGVLPSVALTCSEPVPSFNTSIKDFPEAPASTPTSPEATTAMNQLVPSFSHVVDAMHQLHACNNITHMRSSSTSNSLPCAPRAIIRSSSMPSAMKRGAAKGSAVASRNVAGTSATKRPVLPRSRSGPSLRRLHGVKGRAQDLPADASKRVADAASRKEESLLPSSTPQLDPKSSADDVFVTPSRSIESVQDTEQEAVTEVAQPVSSTSGLTSATVCESTTAPVSQSYDRSDESSRAQQASEGYARAVASRMAVEAFKGRSQGAGASQIQERADPKQRVAELSSVAGKARLAVDVFLAGAQRRSSKRRASLPGANRQLTSASTSASDRTIEQSSIPLRSPLVNVLNVNSRATSLPSSLAANEGPTLQRNTSLHAQNLRTESSSSEAVGEAADPAPVLNPPTSTSAESASPPILTHPMRPLVATEASTAAVSNSDAVAVVVVSEQPASHAPKPLTVPKAPAAVPAQVPVSSDLSLQSETLRKSPEGSLDVTPIHDVSIASTVPYSTGSPTSTSEAPLSVVLDTVDAIMLSNASTEDLADVLSPSAVKTFASDFTSIAGFSLSQVVPHSEAPSAAVSTTSVAGLSQVVQHSEAPSAPVSPTSADQFIESISEAAPVATEAEHCVRVKNDAEHCGSEQQVPSVCHSEEMYAPTEVENSVVSEPESTLPDVRSFWHQLLEASKTPDPARTLAVQPPVSRTPKRPAQDTSTCDTVAAQLPVYIVQETLVQMPQLRPIRTTLPAAVASQGPQSGMSIYDDVQNLDNAEDFLSPVSESSAPSSTHTMTSSKRRTFTTGTPTYEPDDSIQSGSEMGGVSVFSNRVKMFEDLAAASCEGVISDHTGFSGRPFPTAALSRSVSAASYKIPHSMKASPVATQSLSRAGSSDASEKVVLAVHAAPADRAAGVKYQQNSLLPPRGNKQHPANSIPTIEAALPVHATEHAPSPSPAGAPPGGTTPVVHGRATEAPAVYKAKGANKWWNPVSWTSLRDKLTSPASTRLATTQSSTSQDTVLSTPQVLIPVELKTATAAFSSSVVSDGASSVQVPASEVTRSAAANTYMPPSESMPNTQLVSLRDVANPNLGEALDSIAGTFEDMHKGTVSKGPSRQQSTQLAGSECSYFPDISPQMSGDSLFPSLNGPKPEASNKALVSIAPISVTPLPPKEPPLEQHEASAGAEVPGLPETPTSEKSEKSVSADLMLPTAPAQIATAVPRREPLDVLLPAAPSAVECHQSRFTPISKASTAGSSDLIESGHKSAVLLNSVASTTGAVTPATTPESLPSVGMDTVDAMLLSNSFADDLADVIFPTAVQTFESDILTANPAGPSTLQPPSLPTADAPVPKESTSSATMTPVATARKATTITAPPTAIKEAVYTPADDVTLPVVPVLSSMVGTIAAAEEVLGSHSIANGSAVAEVAVLPPADLWEGLCEDTVAKECDVLSQEKEAQSADPARGTAPLVVCAHFTVGGETDLPPTHNAVTNQPTAFEDGTQGESPRSPCSSKPMIPKPVSRLSITSLASRSRSSLDRKPDSLAIRTCSSASHDRLTSKRSASLTGDSALETAGSGSSNMSVKGNPSRLSAPSAPSFAERTPSALAPSIYTHGAVESAVSSEACSPAARQMSTQDSAWTDGTSEAWTLETKPSVLKPAQYSPDESQAAPSPPQLQSIDGSHRSHGSSVEQEEPVATMTWCAQPPPVFLLPPAAVAVHYGTEGLPTLTAASASLDAVVQSSIDTAEPLEHTSSSNEHSSSSVQTASSDAVAVAGKAGAASGTGSCALTKDLEQSVFQNPDSDENFDDFCTPGDSAQHSVSRVVAPISHAGMVPSRAASGISSWNFDTDAGSQSHSVAYSQYSRAESVRSRAPWSSFESFQGDVDADIDAVHFSPDSYPGSPASPVSSAKATPLQCGSFSTLDKLKQPQASESLFQEEPEAAQSNVEEQSAVVSLPGVQEHAAITPGVGLLGEVAPATGVQSTELGKPEEVTAGFVQLAVAKMQRMEQAEPVTVVHSTPKQLPFAQFSKKVPATIASNLQKVSEPMKPPTIAPPEMYTMSAAKAPSPPAAATTSPVEAPVPPASSAVKLQASPPPALPVAANKSTLSVERAQQNKRLPRATHPAPAVKAPLAKLQAVQPTVEQGKGILPTALAGSAFGEMPAANSNMISNAPDTNKLSEAAPLSASLRLFVDTIQPTQATSRRIAAPEPNLQPATVASSQMSAKLAAFTTKEKVVPFQHAQKGSAQQAEHKSSTVASPAFETALKSAAEASAEARKLGVVRQRSSSTAGKRNKVKNQKKPTIQKAQSFGSAASAPGSSASSGFQTKPQGAQEQQHMQQKMQPQGHPASQNWQGGMQQGYNQQQMQYMQAYNTMYMQQQMAAMHAASQMQASYAAPKPEASAPGKEAPNLLRFALLRSIARDVGDKKLANISLKEGQVALDKMQSKSAMSAMSSTPEGSIMGSGGGSRQNSFMGSQMSQAGGSFMGSQMSRTPSSFMASPMALSRQGSQAFMMNCSNSVSQMALPSNMQQRVSSMGGGNSSTMIRHKKHMVGTDANVQATSGMLLAPGAFGWVNSNLNSKGMSNRPPQHHRQEQRSNEKPATKVGRSKDSKKRNTVSGTSSSSMMGGSSLPGHSASAMGTSAVSVPTTMVPPASMNAPRADGKGKSSAGASSSGMRRTPSFSRVSKAQGDKLLARANGTFNKSVR